MDRKLIRGNRPEEERAQMDGSEHITFNMSRSIIAIMILLMFWTSVYL